MEYSVILGTNNPIILIETFVKEFYKILDKTDFIYDIVYNLLSGLEIFRSKINKYDR